MTEKLHQLRKGDISISKYTTGNRGLQKVETNQRLTFLVLCSSAPSRWVKWLWSPLICLSCSPSCSQGSDQKSKLSLWVSCAHCEFHLQQKVELVEEEHELSFFSLRNKGKKKINHFSWAKYKKKKKCSFSHKLRLFKKASLIQATFLYNETFQWTCILPPF